jgi:hypothetical protein
MDRNCKDVPEDAIRQMLCRESDPEKFDKELVLYTVWMTVCESSYAEFAYMVNLYIYSH